MAFIPVPDVVQVDLVYTLDTQIIENVLHYKPVGLPVVDSMVELGEELISWWSTTGKVQCPDEVSLINVKVTDLATNFAPSINVGTGLPIAGTLSGAPLPNNCSLCVTKRTVFRGRSFRGRIYHPALTETDVTANAVSAGRVNAIIAAYEDLMFFTLVEDTWSLGVVSRYSEGEPRVEGIFTPVVALTTDGMVDSQRRRLPGRGQ